jgi:hypothetical protein
MRRVEELDWSTYRFRLETSAALPAPRELSPHLFETLHPAATRKKQNPQERQFETTAGLQKLHAIAHTRESTVVGLQDQDARHKQIH